MNQFNFSEKRELIQKLGKELFDRITNLPQEIRPDDKPRTGIQIVARELETRNIVMESIYEPSEAARFFAVEKSVRTECYKHVTSRQSKNPENMKFAGNVGHSSFTQIHVSVSGLKEEEDVLVAIIILSRLIETPIYEVTKQIRMISNHCLYATTQSLSDQLFEERYYLNTILEEYK